jgi:hypothetical protein
MADLSSRGTMSKMFLGPLALDTVPIVSRVVEALGYCLLLPNFLPDG